MSQVPTPLFSLGDVVLGPDGVLRGVINRTISGLGTWVYTLVPGNINVAEHLLTLEIAGPPPRFDIGTRVIVSIFATGAGTVTNRTLNIEESPAWVYTVLMDDSSQGVGGIVIVRDFALEFETPPPPPPPELPPREFDIGDGVVLEGEDIPRIVVDFRWNQDAQVWQYKVSGSSAWWNEPLLTLAPPEGPPPPTPTDPPTCSGVERAPRGSGDFLHLRITSVEPGEEVSLVANIVNDDGRRDNIQWTATEGTIIFQNWDIATWRAPSFTSSPSVDIRIDGDLQNACRCLFSVPQIGLPTEPGMTFDEFLSFGFWEDQLANAAQILANTGTLIPGNVAAVEALVTSGFSRAEAQIDLTPETAANLVLGGFPSLQQDILAGIGGVMVPIFGGQFNPIEAAIDALPIPSPSELWASFWEGAETFLSPVVSTGVRLTLEALEQGFAVLLKPFIDRILEIPTLDPDMRALLLQLLNPQQQVLASLGQQMGQGMMGGLITGILGPIGREVTTWMNRRSPNVPLDPGTAIQLGIRGWLSPDEMANQVRSGGFNESLQDILVNGAIPRLDPGAVNHQVLRDAMRQAAASAGPEAQGIAGEFGIGFDFTEGADRLGLLGWQGPEIISLLDQRLVLPGVQDLIRFAVREAFTPAIVQEFELDTDFPTDVLPFTRGQGLPDGFARMFWRAHWELPSIQQGFEMLHRGVIEPPELDLLLRTQDVMPFWRERLKDISFNVFTRVDIRRMFDMDIVDAARVEEVYEAQGYSPEDAVSLRQFVERLAVQPTLTARETEVRGQFRVGVIDEERAREILSPVIFRQEVLDATMETAQLDRQGERTLRLMTAWQTAFRKGEIDPFTFRQQLSQLDIPEEEIAFRERLVSILRPSEDPTPEEEELRAVGRGTVLRRFQEGLIDEGDFALEMASLGYSQLQTGRLLTLGVLELDTNLATDLIAAYRAGLRTGRLSESDFREAMADLPVDGDLVEAYITFDQLRRRLEPPPPEEVELRALGSGPVLTRFQEGWTDQAEFQGEMALLGYSQAEINRYQVLADLRFDFDFKQDSLGALRDAFQRELIDADQFIDRLTTLGMDQGRAQVHLAREQLRRISRPAAGEPPPGGVELPP